METEPNAPLAVAPPTPRGRLEFYLRNVLMPAMPTMTSQASSDTVRGAVWFIFDCDPPDATPVDIVATISSAVVNRPKRRACGAALADDVLQQYKQQAAALKKLSDRNARLHEQLQTAKDELASLEALHALETETHSRERDGMETQLRDLQDQVHGADEQNDSMMENLITAERDSMAECESLRMELDAQATSWNSFVANCVCVLLVSSYRNL
jgi:hypothetical protein